MWPCYVDRSRNGQVFDNDIIINAEQAMVGGGGIEVTARNVTLADGAHLHLAAGHSVRLAVADRGVGIPREHPTRVFDPFYTTKPKGTLWGWRAAIRFCADTADAWTW